MIAVCLNQVICGLGQPSTRQANSVAAPSAAVWDWTLSRIRGAQVCSFGLGAEEVVQV